MSFKGSLVQCLEFFVNMTILLISQSSARVDCRSNNLCSYTGTYVSAHALPKQTLAYA
jgi:hypothetical protein